MCRVNCGLLASVELTMAVLHAAITVAAPSSDVGAFDATTVAGGDSTPLRLYFRHAPVADIGPTIQASWLCVYVVVYMQQCQQAVVAIYRTIAGSVAVVVGVSDLTCV